eukprot:7687523-Lingulodinium_polyedra.AAC.1
MPYGQHAPVDKRVSSIRTARVGKPMRSQRRSQCAQYADWRRIYSEGAGVQSWQHFQCSCRARGRAP